MYLANVMYAESELDPSMKNKAGSGATGLIQFMPTTARNLGTTTDELSRMTPVEQMEYVRRYFSADNFGAGRLRNLRNNPSQHNVNMAVFLPSMIGKPVDTLVPEKYHRQNGSIKTPADYSRSAEKRVNAFVKSNPVDTQTDQMLSEEQPEDNFRPEDDAAPSDTVPATVDQAEEEPGFLDTVGEYIGDAYDTASEYASETVDTLEQVAESVGKKLRRLMNSEEESSSSSDDNPPLPTLRPDQTDNPPLPTLRSDQTDNPPLPTLRPDQTDNPPLPTLRPDQTEEAFSAVEDFVGTLKKAEGGSVEREVEFVKEDDDDVPDPPPGATPEEVADDIPAYLSTGEYVLPANVVRYLGLKNITGMHQRALSELQQMEDLDIIENVDENGYVEEDDDEMDYMKPEGVVEIVVAEHHPKGLMAMGFAEGGPVEAMVYVPGVGFVPQSQAATRSSRKKTVEDTQAETREGPSGRGGTDTGKSMSEMSPMEQAAFGGALSGPLGGAIESVSKGIVGSALGLASPLGVERGYSQATGVPTAAQQAMKSVDLDIAKAKEMYAMSPSDLSAAQSAFSGPVGNTFGATTNQMQAHEAAVAAGTAPAGSHANAAGGYSTKGDYGFSTNNRGDVVGNDPDRNGVPGDQTGTSMAGATDDAGTAGAPGMGDSTGSGVGSGVEGGAGTTGGHDDGGEDSAESSEAAGAEAEAAGAKRGGYVTRNGIMARGYSEGGMINSDSSFEEGQVLPTSDIFSEGVYAQADINRSVDSENVVESDKVITAPVAFSSAPGKTAYLAYITPEEAASLRQAKQGFSSEGNGQEVSDGQYQHLGPKGLMSFNGVGGAGGGKGGGGSGSGSGSGGAGESEGGMGGRGGGIGGAGTGSPTGGASAPSDESYDGAEAGDEGGGMGGPGGTDEYRFDEVEQEVEEKPTDPYEGYTYVKGIGYVPTSRRATSDKPIESASLALSSIFTPSFLTNIGLMSDPNEEL
jgi:hypothetical protein